MLVMLPFGFRLYPAGMVTGLVLLAIFGIGLGALSYALAVSIKGQEWLFYAVQQTLLFPVLILSGMLLPIDSAPGWMQALSAVNPLTYVVEAERVLFAGESSTQPILYGMIAVVVLAILGLGIGTRQMRRAGI